ncbi:MAG: prephenate dehydrogenase/arogenate dehydrogenase family protein [Acidimicrobiales bacterium]|jgi:prephenate dehydrogenase
MSRHAQVVGLGLVGSSIAGGLRARGWYVTGSDLDGARAARAAALRVIDAVGRDTRAEIAFVATPASGVVPVVRELLAGSERPDLIVTDVAGVKGPIVAELAHPRFVAGHPMAGSEQEGPDGADPELFVGATWVLTPTDATDPVAFTALQSVIASLGADVVALAPERHDELVAVISHVPHLASATLMSLAGESPVDHAALMRLAAGGFRDMTRIAAGSPAIWPDICRDNAGAIVPVLDRLIDQLTEVRRIVADGDREALSSLLERARSARRNLPPRGARPVAVAELRVLVPDRPGVLAEVTTLAGELGVNIYDLEIAHSAEGPRGVLVLVVDAAVAETVVTPLRARGFRVSWTTAS